MYLRSNVKAEKTSSSISGADPYFVYCSSRWCCVRLSPSLLSESDLDSLTASESALDPRFLLIRVNVMR